VNTIEQGGWHTPDHYNRPSGALTTPQTENGFPNRKYKGNDGSFDPSPQSVPTPNPTPGRPIHSSPIEEVGYRRKDELEIVPEKFETFEGTGVSDFGFSSGSKGGLQAKPPKAMPPPNKMDAFRNSIDNKKPKVPESPVIPSPGKPQVDFANFSESKASIPDGLSATSSKRSYSKRDGLESRAALMKKMKDRATRKSKKDSILKPTKKPPPERSQTVPDVQIDLVRSNADTLGQSNYDTTSFAPIETPARAADLPTPKKGVTIDAPETQKEQFRDTAS
jgi:hypothetical protein